VATQETEPRQIWEVNQTELAGFFGCTTVSLRSWGLKPIRTAGRMKIYDLRAVVRQRVGHSAEVLDLSDERAKLARAQREKIDLELARLAGDLLDADLVVRAWAALLIAFRSRVERCIATIENAASAGDLEAATAGELATELRVGLDDLAALDIVAAMPEQSDQPGITNGQNSQTAVDCGMGRRKPHRKPRSKRARRKVAD